MNSKVSNHILSFVNILRIYPVIVLKLLSLSGKTSLFTCYSVRAKDLQHKQFLKRVTKTLYYGKLSATDCFSLPVTELSAEFFTKIKCAYTFERLEVEQASRISKLVRISPCALILALIYIERLKDCNPEYFERVTPYQLFLVSLMVGSKFLYEDGVDDQVVIAEWAISGKLTVSELVQLEKDFLQAIDWAVFVQQKNFWERLQQLEKDVAYREVQKRGWCTYTELSCLMDASQLIIMARVVIRITYICMVSYVAGLLTLYGSILVGQSVGTMCFFGVSLSPDLARQQACLYSANATSNAKNFIPLEPLTNAHHRAPLSTIIDSELPAAIDSPIRNSENVANCRFAKINVDEGDNDLINWQWWLNSTMSWLPKYCGLKSNVTGKVVESTGSLFDVELNSTQAGKLETRENPALKNYCHYYAVWSKILSSALSQLAHYWGRLHKLHRRIAKQPPAILIC